MDLFKTLNKIYTARDTDWVKDIDSNVSNVPINIILSYNIKLSNVVAFLDKYTFRLDVKNFCILAWAIIHPKYNSMPFSKKIKANEKENNKYQFLLDKIQTRMEISNNDWVDSKNYYIEDIERRITDYLTLFGCTKKEWKSIGIDFEESKKINIVDIKKGLDKWF